MLYIWTPSVSAIAALQRTEGQYYWSAAAEVLFRGQGLLSVETSAPPSDARGCGVVATRGAKPDLSTRRKSTFWFFEGPVAPEIAAALGIKVNPFSIRGALDLHWSNGTVDTLSYSEEHYTSPEGGTPLIASEPGWMRRCLEGQTFEAVDAWTVHLWLVDPLSGEPKPVLISRDGVYLCGLPLLDVAVRESAFPPLAGRYHLRNTTAASIRLVKLVTDLLIAYHCAQSYSSPILRIARWPAGYLGAFTIRHDYDRRISDESIGDLLDLYDSVDVKCSIGFLSYLAPERVVRAFQARGHEIQLHSHMADLGTFCESLATVRQAAGGEVVGATVHGGRTGFVGDTFFGWAEQEGLEYVEGFFNAVSAPVSPIIRIGAAGIPAPSRLMGLRGHVSLDTGTKPGSSQLDYAFLSINSMLASGDYAILMNHPDLNRNELRQILRNMDFGKVWRATQMRVADWFRTTHFESTASATNGLLELVFPRVVREEVNIDILWAGDNTELILSAVREAKFICQGGVVNRWS